MTNHWGYNTLGFFAPTPPTPPPTDPQGVVDEVKGMVKLLHREGIEVILDVVYNHTAEQDRTGATLSWRGLDQRAYYRLDERGRDIDVTGCGNTLDLRHPVVCRMVLDSLRYWVQEFHVDGFRFDLAVALGRGRGDEFDPDHPFLVALRTDPVLSRVTLIAEPWDLGMHGWRTGQFPPPFMEWNDRFRDAVRRFWVGDVRAQAHGQHSHGLQDLATRLAGFARPVRAPRPGARPRRSTSSPRTTASRSPTSTSYDHKHNEANGEDNRDGSDGNTSWNHGVEGATDDAGVRRRPGAHHAQRCSAPCCSRPACRWSTPATRWAAPRAATTTPTARTTRRAGSTGTSRPGRRDLLATTQHLVRVRQELPALRQRVWALGRQVHDDGSRDMEWYAADGTAMGERWDHPGTRVVQMYVAGAWLGADSALLVVNGGAHEHEVTLPAAPGVTAYRLLWDSDWERPQPGRANQRTGPGDGGRHEPAGLRGGRRHLT